MELALSKELSPFTLYEETGNTGHSFETLVGGIYW